MIDFDYIYNLDFFVVWNFRIPLIKALFITISYAVAASLLGTIVGCLMAILEKSKLFFIRWFVRCFVELFRNTPLLVQLIWIHFALPLATGLNTSIYQSALISITCNAAAYITEIFRAGVQTVSLNQWEAAKSLGLSNWSIWRLVILPQAIRIVLPPLSNMYVSLLKGTAILSILSVEELMRVSARISTYTAKPVEVLTIGALMYFIVGLGLTTIFSKLERRFRLPD